MDGVVPRSDDRLRARALRKITLRVVPLLMVGYVVSYVDRINVGFAKFGMDKTFGLSATQYGFVAGIFFVGYILAEVPSNIVMSRVGARLWLSRILVTWGLIAAATAFAPNFATVCALRFLLGVAEAGFFPGIIVYLTRWYPNAERTRVISTVMVAIPVASVIGGPLNGWILDTLDGAWGLSGWRWVFIVGGVPAIVLGVAFFLALTETPAHARWLTDSEKAWLTETLAAEHAERAAAAPAGHLAALRSGKVIALCAAYFLLLCGAYPLTYWMPSVIEKAGHGLSGIQVGWLSAVPFLAAAICMYGTGRLVRDERSARPVLIALAVSVAAFAITAVRLDAPAVAFVTITVATMAAQTAKPLFWSVPTGYLAGAGAASGIALINSLGNAAGFVSPYAFGWIQDATGGDTGPAMSVMIFANVAAFGVLAVLASGVGCGATPGERLR
ncbi:MFS transporter [Nocardia terpenica]|uniref:MFS transporter n=1 Tax=Nocardia terpenica TaxID=455432 RepID=A0A164KN84_9NOCA|nr:MFS transporter [Nocardia terpenica]KZM71557.1 MFS transporter [Nocardia terpenica]NQE90749.1 MFS transporter [Nocardia terpenica]